MFKLILIIFLYIYYLYRYKSTYILPLFANNFCSFVGLPGSGKTTIATFLSYFWGNIFHKKIYANFPCPGTLQYDVTDLGVWNVSNGVLLLDEAGIDMSNRKIIEKQMKGIKEENRKFWKLYRHYHIKHVYIFSQAQDYDITLRRLCSKHFVIDKRGNYTKIIPLIMKLDISDDGLTPVFKLQISKLVLWFDRRPFYGMFDTYEAPVLPEKEFEYIPMTVTPSSDPFKKFNEIKQNFYDYYEYILESHIDILIAG